MADISTKYQWISHTPPILMHSTLQAEDITDYLPDFPVTRIVQLYWDCSAPQMARIVETYRRPEHNDRIILLANSARSQAEFVMQGLEAYFIHHNALLDESLYTIGRQPPEFDAIAVARATRFKRQELAEKIPKPAFVAPVDPHDPDSVAYIAELERRIPHGTFAPIPKDWAMLDPRTVASWMQRSRVGLILSAHEGGSYVTGEYQLCGLPVVSTIARDGRTAWMDPEYCRLVLPDADAVAEAVAELVSLAVDPVYIRNRAIQRSLEHRQRLSMLIETLCGDAGTPRDLGRAGYARLLRFREVTWCPLRELRDRYEQECVL